MSGYGEGPTSNCEQRTRSLGAGQQVPPSEASEDPDVETRAVRKAWIREELVNTTLFLIQRDGLDALTMRTLAEYLGKSAAGTYRHVPSKTALLELAADHVMSRIAIPDPSSGDWESRLRQIARSTWVELRMHPWVAGFLIERDQTTPAQQVAQGAAVAVLAEAGFTGPCLRLAFGFYWAFLFGSLSALQVRDATKFSSPERFARNRADQGVLPDLHFDFGTTAMVAGLRAQLAMVSERPSPSSQ